MNTIKKQRLTLLIFFMFFLVSGVSGQDWRKIVPLSSTCEDVKALLEVNYCMAPDSSYKFPDMSVYILVSDGKDNRKVQEGTVISVGVSFRIWPLLKDFVKDINVHIEDFEVLPVDDLPSFRRYRSYERGIVIETQRVWSNSDEEYVRGVDLFPPQPKKEQSSPSFKQYQEWRKITPLVTSCEDIKKILDVDECKIPVSTYKSPELSLNISISKGDDKWKVPRGTVTGVLVLLRTLPLLEEVIEELGAKLEDFEVLPDDDLPNSRIFRNNKLGISISAQQVMSISDKFYAGSIHIYPNEQKRKRHLDNRCIDYSGT